MHAIARMTRPQWSLPCQTIWHTVRCVEPTPLQLLATNALGTDVVEWARARRNADPAPSFQSIARDLRLASNGQVDVTDETIRLWVAS